MTTMRGLTMFITDIRNCTTKEQEQKRVDKEMANIRAKFTSKSLDSYGKKKYTWKLLYMYMLGYEIEIGHMEALKLIAGTKFSEKVCGYMACSLLLNEDHELLRLIIQSVKKDLMPTNEFHQSLALACIANVGGQEFAESLSADVQQILLSVKSKSYVRKKAALALLRMYRKYPEVISTEGFAPKVLSLLDDHNLGVAVSVMGLVLGMVSVDIEGWEQAPDKAISLLTKLVYSQDRKSIYKYYLTICPWLQVKLLRMLQYFPPPEEEELMTRMNLVLGEILTKTVVTKNVNKNNADHSILFEALSTIIHLCIHGKTELHAQAVTLLGRFVSIREPNFRYLGLETMSRLARIPGTIATIKRHQNTIQFSLQDPDISIRKRALDLLYVMCDKSNAREIVAQLLKYLQHCSFDLREELVLKIAILSEKFAIDLRWYLDCVLQLLTVAGDYVSDDIWYRVCQIVTNNEDLQDYAATTCFKFLNSPTVHENGVKVAAYILGEFGHQIQDKQVTGPKLFDCLRCKFPTSEPDTKALILSAYIKMSNTYPELKEVVNQVFESHRTFVDCEIQQRACEYFSMNQTSDEDLLNQVFDVMPNFPERESNLLKRLRKVQKSTTDRDVWVDADGKKKKKKKDKDDNENDDSDSDGSSSSDEEESGSESSDSGSSSDSDSSSSDDSDEESLFGSQDVQLLTALFKAKQGRLYQSSGLEIGCQHVVENNTQVKMILYYGNKTKSDLEDLHIQLSQQDALKVQIKPDAKANATAEGHFNVPAGSQIKQFLLLQIAKPFASPLQIKVNFKHGGKSQAIILTLPVLTSTFFSATPLEKQAFISTWQSNGGANEVLATRKLNTVMNVDEFKEVLVNGLNASIMEGVDKNPANIWASATMNTPTTKMPVVLRVETKPNMPVVRITVHSGHKTVSEACVASLSSLVRATNV